MKEGVLVLLVGVLDDGRYTDLVGSVLVTSVLSGGDICLVTTCVLSGVHICLLATSVLSGGDICPLATSVLSGGDICLGLLVSLVG